MIRDIKTEAAIWLARIYNETGNYIEANRMLNLKWRSPLPTSKAIRSMYYTTLADLFIRQKRYSEAIDPLRIINRIRVREKNQVQTYISSCPVI